jgi:glycosyltransferase involved in cell wall biosynthesis
MKIGVIVDNELNKDIRVLREIKILREQEHEIFVLCFAFGPDSCKAIPGITITRIKIKRWIKNLLYLLLNTLPAYEWFWASKTAKFLLSNEIDAVHVHDLYMSRAVHNALLKSGKVIPMILDLHENYPYTVMTYNWTKGFLRSLISQPGKWKVKEKEYLGYANKFIVLSNEFRDLLITRNPQLLKENFAVLPNVPDLSQLEARGTLPANILFKDPFPVIFYFGVIAERRGVFDALRVFIDLVNEKVPVNFLFIGPVDKKDKERFLKQVNLESVAGRIKYIPWIDFSDLWTYLGNCDICIAPFHKNPQHESGVANKIFDYMLGAKPVIVSDCLPQQNLIEKYKCGLVYSNDIEMRESILKLLENKDLRVEMGLNGYNAVIQEFNTNIVKQELLILYNQFKITTNNNRS